MTIRFLGDDDSLYDVSRVYEESWKYAYKGIVQQEFLDSIPEGRWATSTVSFEGRYSLVLTDGDNIVGTTCFCRSRWENYPDDGEIVSLYLLPEYMGKGYGKMLLKRALKELRTLGFGRVLLWTLEENRHARKFYELNGFFCTNERRTDNIGGAELTEILYMHNGGER